MDDAPTRVTCIVLAYGEEPLLRRCVESILASREVSADVVLIDNGCLNPDIGDVGQLAGVTLLKPHVNLGFAAGANLGARSGRGDLLAFVNSDAVVESHALHEFAKALRDPLVGLVTGSLRLMAQPNRINSCGNPVHYTGVSWAGGMGRPASHFMQVREVASASGAAMACRREVWLKLGGFLDEMFAYLEDTELSLRCWQRGLKVLFVPGAVVLHDYEFSRNASKLGLLERNRLIMLLTLYERRTLAVLTPALLAVEMATLALSVKQGWSSQKLRGWLWLIRHRRWIRQRREEMQAQRIRDDVQVMRHMTAGFDPGQQFGRMSLRLINNLSKCYWALVRGLLGAGRASRAH